MQQPMAAQELPSTLKMRLKRRGEAGSSLWVSYRLQSLSAKRFIAIANKILSGEYRLLRLSDTGEIT